jgi:hypothetical protein
LIADKNAGVFDNEAGLFMMGAAAGFESVGNSSAGGLWGCLGCLGTNLAALFDVHGSDGFVGFAGLASVSESLSLLSAENKLLDFLDEAGAGAGLEAGFS